MKDQRTHWAKAAKLGPLASVIDPKDTKGFKNKYISYVKERAIRAILPNEELIVLDFGCGSGNLSNVLASSQYRIVGIDISFDLLKLATQQNDLRYSPFLHYDGKQIPLKDKSCDYATTYGVFIHILDDDQLIDILKEVHRVLSVNGKLICIEQTRRYGRNTDNNLKNQRSEENYRKIFALSGFCVEKVEFIRLSRFPLIYFIRYGLISPERFEMVAKIDKWCASIFHKPIFSYVDTLFILKKQSKENG